MIRSGAWRSAVFRPICRVCVSRPTSRWLTTDFLLLKMNSIGSSIVRMWPAIVLVALLEHRRQRRALAGAGRADHQDQAALFHHQRAQDRRHVEALERRDLERDAAEHGGDRAALLEARETEAADAGEADADVELAGVLELLELARRQQLGEQLARLRVRQRLVGELQQLAVDLDQDRRAGGEVDVGRALLGHQPQDALHVAATHARSLQLRSSSLMLVLARVCASTRLTMTAQ